MICLRLKKSERSNSPMILNAYPCKNDSKHYLLIKDFPLSSQKEDLGNVKREFSKIRGINLSKISIKRFDKCTKANSPLIVKVRFGSIKDAEQVLNNKHLLKDIKVEKYYLNGLQSTRNN